MDEKMHLIATVFSLLTAVGNLAWVVLFIIWFHPKGR